MWPFKKKEPEKRYLTREEENQLLNQIKFCECGACIGLTTNGYKLCEDCERRGHEAKPDK